MSWFDIATLRARDGYWSASTAEDSLLENVLARGITRQGSGGRFVRSVVVHESGTEALVLLEQSGDGKGAGCRSVAVAWRNLAERPKGLPTLLAVSVANAKFEARGLLTLRHLASAKRRQVVFERLSIQHADGSEGWQKFESDAVDWVSRSNPHFVPLEPRRLCRDLANVRSTPDGLFVDESSNELVIVEVKDRRLSFEEGASQLVQYAAQAAESPSLRNLSVRSILVTSDGEANKQLRTWKQLVAAPHDVRILVDWDAAPYVDVT